MAMLNQNFLNLKQNYLFTEIAKRVTAYREAHPEKTLIRMGIGDVTRPLAPAVVAAMHKGVDEMGAAETFHGYDDSGRGYPFLREAIAGYYKNDIGAAVDADEIFISDGAKSDCGNFGDILSADNIVLLTDPVYPVYFDANVMAGREIRISDSNESNGFAAMPDDKTTADIIYLCSPNNPTGAAYTKEQLTEWVSFAIRNRAVIIYDAAYEAFVSDTKIPRSIFTIDGARECAVEICSLSKTAGFTGTRLGYTVVPKELKLYDAQGGTDSAHRLWARRQGTKFNGVSYPVQCGAAAVFTDEGLRQVRDTISYYMNNAKVVADKLTKLGIPFTGGVHSPYIWFKCPGNNSWDYFDRLLDEHQIVGTPGAGFGKNGEGWFRLTAFNTYENTALAMSRI
ncbi:LL-diaminopimelate aminotransferase [Clostridia bacterium]|nr:LL-diaminopimelate aminotransferase [Clostridia bacterium]